MKILKNTLIVLSLIIGLLLIFSLFLPSKIHVQRTATIKAKPDTLFALVNELKNWNKWSAWAQIDPSNTQWVFSQPSAGVGAWYTWKSSNKNVGAGKLTIIQSDPDKYVKNLMSFGEEGDATSEFIIKETAGGSEVIFTMDMDMGVNPIGKYMGLMMDKWIGQDYETCLKNIAAITE